MCYKIDNFSLMNRAVAVASPLSYLREFLLWIGGGDQSEFYSERHRRQWSQRRRRRCCCCCYRRRRWDLRICFVRRFHLYNSAWFWLRPHNVQLPCSVSDLRTEIHFSLIFVFFFSIVLFFHFYTIFY